MELTNELVQTLSRLVTVKERKYLYQKTDGQYETYCPYCQTYKKVDWNTFKSIRNSKHCPICNSEFVSTTNKITDKFYRDYVQLDLNGESVGYEIISHFQWKKPIEPVSQTKMLKFRNNSVLVRKGYYLGSYGHNIYYDFSKDDGTFRRSYSQNYSCNCFDYYCNWTYRYGTRSDVRKFLEDCFHITKSNQIKMVLKNRYSFDEVKGMKVFNVNTEEDMEKYREYFRKNQYHFREYYTDKIKCNIFLLEYLAKNKISMGNYYTYVKNLELLKMKIDRPTDFEYRFKVVEEMVQAEKDKVIKEGIDKRFPTLPHYSDGEVTIDPFETPKEIRDCGKSLHNCIGGYVQSYAEGKTDIYHLDVSKKTTVAIEIKNLVLVQAYIDHNKKCPAELMKHIKSFCNSNGFSLGNYA